MPTTTLPLAKKLIAVRSDPDRAAELAKVLRIACAELQGFRIEHFEKNGSRSILVHNGVRRPKRFTVLLNGHLDVIPGSASRYRPIVRGDRLCGVGSMDMKANVASMIAVFRRIAPKVSYPLGLQIVTDEEIGGFDGTKHQIEQGVRADFVIAGESTGFDIVNAAKGILWLKLTCHGKTAHGAYPWRGTNAVLKMHRALERLVREFSVSKRDTWRTTINVSRVETENRSFNKIPADCTAWLDIRFIPKDEKTVLKKLRRLLPRDFKIELIAQEPALSVDAKNPFLQRLHAASSTVARRKVRLYGANGSSDARHFTQVGCAGIEFGPVGANIGTDDEWVSIRSLAAFEKILEQFLLGIEHDRRLAAKPRR